MGVNEGATQSVAGLWERWRWGYIYKNILELFAQVGVFVLLIAWHRVHFDWFQIGV